MSRSTRSATTSTDTVREWMNELTGRNERANVAIRVPPQAEITQLTSMFPDISRDTVIGALQRRLAHLYRYQTSCLICNSISPNVEAAVETLLSAQR